VRRALTALVAAASVASVFAAPAAAQQAVPSGRGKFILGLGAGYAATKTDCSNCGSSEEGDPNGSGATYDDVGVVSISMLWRASAKVVAGAEVQLETARENAQVLYLMGSVRFHPWASQGFFIRGGFGMVQVKSRLPPPDGSGGTGTYRGIGFDYGIGWELFKDSKISFAPFGSHYVSTLASVTLGEFESVNVIGNTWLAGIRFFFN
jgi:opacity protein-like surface antigen